MPNNLDISTLENWLWEAACKIRGEIDAPKYKDYILGILSEDHHIRFLRLFYRRRHSFEIADRPIVNFL